MGILPTTNPSDTQATATAKAFSGYLGANPKASISFVRPADTNIYAVNDTISSAVLTPATQFISIPSNQDGISGLISDALLVSDYISSGTAPIIYVALMTTQVNWGTDNAANAVTVAQMANCAAFISFATQIQFGACGVFEGTIVKGSAFVRGGIDKKLYPYFSAGSAFTPISGQTFTLLLGIV